MRPTLRTLRFVVPVAALLALGAVSYLKIRDGAAEASAEEGSATVPMSAAGAEGDAPPAADMPIPVEGATVVRDTLVVSVTATGQAAPRRQAQLLAQVAGRVAAVPVRESQRVGAGAPIVVLDSAELLLRVEEARSRLRQTEAQYAELTLFDDRIPDAAQRAERARVARARSGLDGAEVAVKQAELELARARVAAPFAGEVANLAVVPGQQVRVGDALATVLDLDPIVVEVQVLEGEVGWLRPGRSAAVSFAAFPGETFRGIVESINPMVDSTTRTARVRVVVPNPERRILPGMYARVSLEARRFPDRLLVPRAAVLERDRRTMLFVYEGDEKAGLAKWRYVTTGLGNDSLVEIVEHPETELVRPGETVLVDGHHTLTHDARVRVVERVAREEGRP